MIFSNSKVNAYQKCPYSYKKQFIDKVSFSNMYMLRGEFVHAALEYFHKHLENQSPALVMSEAYRYAKDVIQKKNKGTFDFKSAKPFLQDYIYFLGKKERPAVAKDSSGQLLLEKKFSVEIEGYQFRGVIDRIDQVSKDEYLIVDYKTSKNDKYLVGSFQPYIYYYGAKEILGLEVKLNFAYLLLGIPKLIVKEIAQEKLMKEIDSLKQLVQKIENDKIFKRVHSNLCYYCESYKDDCRKQLAKVLA